MGKRFWSLMLSVALIGGVFAAIPAQAQEDPPTPIPAVVNIEDPVGDANYINDQGAGAPLPGDTVLPASAGTVSDILKAWFTSDADSISAHILTKAAPPASTPLIFHVRVDPGSGTECLWFRASFPSAVQGQADPVVPKKATVRDTCATAVPIFEGELKVETAGENNGLVTMTFPRSSHPAFAEGNVLKAPTADSRNFPGGLVTAPQIDDTKPGTDFTVTSGGAPVSGGPGEPSEPNEPPGKNDPPGKGKKKGCGKGTGAKKGACPGKKAPKPKPPVASCPAYVPGEEGAGAETSIVTDAATEDKPIELAIDAPMGIPEVSAGHVFQNIQVDTAGAESGLYVRYEFPVYEDHDIYLNYADGSEAAHAGGFNPTPVAVLDGTGSGGHSEQGAENLDGIRSADCAGYTLDMTSFASEGGEMTLKLWLGEPQNDPAPPGEGALRLFYDMTGLRNPSATDAPEASATPAGNKGCTKGGGKKNGCKKPPVGCAPFVPGEAGADKPLVTVTDAATEEAPVEQEITLAPSAADADLVGAGQPEPSFDYFNVQVDSTSASKGLYVLFQFPERRDYDLELLHPDKSYAARSHDFNPICGSPVSCSNEGHGGEAGPGFEKLVGINTSDCGGWTVEGVNWLGEGGKFKIKVWLGDAVNEPLPPGAEPHS